MARRRGRVQRTRRVRTPHFTAYRYKAPARTRLSRQRAVQVIRSRLTHVDPDAVVWVRGRGGRPEYRNDWWSAPPIEADELNDMDDDELREFLGGLQDPWELDLLNET